MAGKPTGPASPPQVLAVGRADRRGELYPAKARPERKIDAAVALMMAVGHAMAECDGRTVDLDAFLDHPVFA